ncbi:hypothetical protein CPB85DRAFT_220754 [Mucidula mucida]|nr:hypothetical protein CPB85DRAFT_220754 [Mucidula mucida]
MPRPSYSANFPDIDEPTLKRKRPSSEDATPAPPNNKKLRAMSNVVQREFEAELRAERYKAKYLKTIDVLPKRTGELKQVKAELQDTKAELQDTKAELEDVKTRNAQLKAQIAELDEARRAVHEQTTRDIVEVRFHLGFFSLS